MVNIKRKIKSSLVVELSEQMAEELKPAENHKLYDFTYALFVFLTTSLILLSMLFTADKIGFFAVDLNMLLLVVGVCAFFTCTYMVFPFKWILIIVSHLFILFEIWQRWTYIFNGGIFLVRDMIQLVNSAYGTSFIYPQQQVYGDKEVYIFAIVLLLAALLSSVLSFMLSKGKGTVICGVVGIAVFWACTNLSAEKIYMPIIVAVFGIFMALVIGNIGRVNDTVKAKKNKKAFVFLGDNRVLTGAVSVLVVVAVSFGAIFYFVPSEKQVYNAPFNDISKNPQQFFRRLSELNLFNIPGLNLFNLEAGIGGGSLDIGSRPHGTGKTDLMVAIPNESKPYVFPYLKGYVGSTYNSEKRQWEDLDPSIYNRYSDVFNALEKNKITIQSFTKLYTGDDIKGNPAIISQVSVKNIDANNKYTYFPYNLLTDYFNSDNFTKGDFVNDTYIKGNKDKIDKGTEYEFDMLRNTEGLVSYLLDKGVLEGSKMDEIDRYGELLSEGYLALPENGVERIKQDAVKLKEQLGNYDTIQGVFDIVRDYLKEHATYDLNAGAIPNDKDFAEYFLYESHKGYCVHFATAGTLLFRAMGIPARYVEGYIITGEDISYKPDGWSKIPDKNAHAWVEVWISNGWTPVEVTPGFNGYNDTSNSDGEGESTGDTSSNQSEATSSEAVSSEAVSSNVSSSPSSVSTSSLADKNDGGVSGQSAMSLETKMLIITALLLVALALIAALMHYTAITKRNKGFKAENKNVAYRHMYSYLLEIVEFVGIKQGVDETESDFANRVDSELPALQGQFGKLTEIALLAKFSPHEIGEEKLTEIANLSKEVSEKVYQGLSIGKRIKFIVISHLK